MREVVRRHTVAVAAVVSLVAIGVVVATVRGFVPAGVLPRWPALVHAAPTINVGLSIVAIVTISLGWHWARTHEIRKHRLAMVTSTVLFATFLGLYLYHIVVAGTTGFPGPEAVYQFVYLPILVVHMLLAMCCIPLVVYALLLGVTHSTDELPRTPHPRVGRVAASLWIVSFALGVVVYLLLHVVY
ncbi:DUF420 domain-containing protein [Halospeciosus flavus]|uniref:DUF420 domain-containing protein n=1 Tax=Halospeciosus flavus TaxID=3032283 RepID=A0ABD5Z1H9_9EURY|nr:DUF420 domain-containing protein [Halospeciosus flavus]